MRTSLSAVATAATLSLLLVACDAENMPVAPDAEVDGPEALADYGKSATRTYEVTIYNLTKGQPFTPPVLASHNRRTKIFRKGRKASYGVQQVAENGNNGPLVESLQDNPKVHAVTQGAAPIMPGASMTFTIEGKRGMNRLSWVSMLICTNDGFAGTNSVRLPGNKGHTKYYRVRGWDAGTEKNTESFSDMVPPCAPLTGVMTDEMGTGMSNPDLATNQRVHRHRGIKGRDDLLPDLHGWKGPVAKISIKRVS